MSDSTEKSEAFPIGCEVEATVTARSRLTPSMYVVLPKGTRGHVVERPAPSHEEAPSWSPEPLVWVAWDSGPGLFIENETSVYLLRRVP